MEEALFIIAGVLFGMIVVIFVGVLISVIVADIKRR